MNAKLLNLPGGASLCGMVILVLLFASPAAAQNPADFSYSILGAVPSEMTLETPSVTSSTLTSTDLRTTGGIAIKVYEFVGERGTPVSIDVMSEDFDAYVMLIGPGFPEVQTDDDSGGACNARLTVFLPGTGTYRVVAGSLVAEGGDFTLRLDNREHPALQGDCGGGGDYLADMAALESQGFAEIGGEVTGDLLIDGPTVANGAAGAAWELIGTVGQTVFVDLMSDEFDSLLYITGPDVSGYMTDDDSGGACNSRLQLTFGSDEPYRIVASALGEGQGGLYTIRVSETELPLSNESCF